MEERIKLYEDNKELSALIRRVMSGADFAVSVEVNGELVGRVITASFGTERKLNFSCMLGGVKYNAWLSEVTAAQIRDMAKKMKTLFYAKYEEVVQRKRCSTKLKEDSSYDDER